MPPDLENPLTEEDFQQITDSIAQTLEIEKQIAKAKRAGLDFGDMLQGVKDQRVRLQALKQTYFPGR